MKKVLLFLSLALLTALSTQAQIPNPGFETWVTGGESGQYEDPDNWGMSNQVYEYFDLLGTTTPSSVVKVAGYTGTYAAKMQNVSSSFPIVGVIDTLPGFVMSWSYDANDEIVEYFPWNTRSAALTGYYKFNQGATGIFPDIDTAAIIVGFYKWNPVTSVSDSIGGGELDIFVTQSGFVSFSVPLSYLTAGVPDSANITLSSSIAQKSFPGTFLIVDDLAFTGVVSGVNTANFPAGKAPYAFPNPAKDQINIGNLPSESASIEVRDLTGRVVLASTASASQTAFNLNGLKEGMYIYTLLDSEGSILFTDRFAVTK